MQANIHSLTWSASNKGERQIDIERGRERNNYTHKRETETNITLWLKITIYTMKWFSFPFSDSGFSEGLQSILQEKTQQKS